MGEEPAGRMRLGALAVTLVSTLLGPVAPAAPAESPLGLTLEGPASVLPGARHTYGGRLTLLGLGVPAQRINLLADGEPVAAATTNGDGAYLTVLSLGSEGVLQLHAQAYQELPIEVRSTPLTVTVMRPIKAGGSHTCALVSGPLCQPCMRHPNHS